MESEQTFNFGIKGYVKPGFEHVLKKFEALYKNGDDKRSQLVVYVGTEKVVDVHGGMSADSITNIYSNGKCVAAICLSLLHEKGLFQYEDKISKNWPEFGQNGKEDITIADLMRHEGGLMRVGEK